MRKTESNMLFINGFLAGAVLTMISFIEVFRNYPEQRLFLGALIFMTALVMGIVFQFCYMELRATNGLRWAFEQAEGKIPPRVFELHGHQIEPSLDFLVTMHDKIRRHGFILLALNVLKLMTTLLGTLALARWQSNLMVFMLVWAGASHLWIYVLSARSLRNGQISRREIFNLLQIHQFRLKKRL